MKSEQWKTYRTRFLVKAKQLRSTLSFVDALGRQHSGRKGDYLVESSDGVVSIAPRQIFEDIYVPMLVPVEPVSNPTAGQATLGKKPVSASRSRLNFDPPEIEAVRIEAVRIEPVRLEDRPVDRQLVNNRLHDRVHEKDLVMQQAGTRESDPRALVTGEQDISPDQPARVGRKLPQPCRDRRAATPNLRLM